MDIDITQPWGVAIDFAGRATVAENGHTVHVNVSDTSLSTIIAPDPLTGQYPPVDVTAQFTEAGDEGATLRGYGRVTVQPVGTDPVAPDRTAVQRAVAAALADFEANTAAYAALCARWTSDGGTGSGSGTDSVADSGTDSVADTGEGAA